MAVLYGLPQDLLVPEVHAVEHPDGEAGLAVSVDQDVRFVDEFHGSVAAESLSMGMTRLARSPGDSVVSYTSWVEPPTLNFPEPGRRRPARCAPQPSA